jgi:hypothetical protein
MGHPRDGSRSGKWDSGSEEGVENPFEEIKRGMQDLIYKVPILPMETEDGGREWRFAPGEGEEQEMARILAIFDGWEEGERERLLLGLQERGQEITEILRIVRAKITLNRTNRHFMGYLREGAPPSAGRDFYLTTFVRTVDHLQGIWQDVLRQDAPKPAPSLLPEGQ